MTNRFCTKFYKLLHYVKLNNLQTAKTLDSKIIAFKIFQWRKIVKKVEWEPTCRGFKITKHIISWAYYNGGCMDMSVMPTLLRYWGGNVYCVGDGTRSSRELQSHGSYLYQCTYFNFLWRYKIYRVSRNFLHMIWRTVPWAGTNIKKIYFNHGSEVSIYIFVRMCVKMNR